MVQSTLDYKIFKVAPNKPINKRHLKKLEKEIAANDLGRHFPITCIRLQDGSLLVTNGQHRLATRIKLGLPIWFEDDGLSLADERRAEKFTLKWSKEDIISYNASLNNENYIRLKEVEIETGWKIGSFMQGIINFTRNIDDFDNGNILFSEKNKYILINLVNLSKRVASIIPFNITRKNLICVMWHISNNKNVDIEKLFDKLKKYNELFLPKITIDGYLESFERVYNYHSRSKYVSFKRTVKEKFINLT